MKGREGTIAGRWDSDEETAAHVAVISHIESCLDDGMFQPCIGGWHLRVLSKLDMSRDASVGCSQAGNAATQLLLRAVNMSGKLHMVPAVINDDYVIRFAVCSVSAADDDIKYAWNVITETTSTLSSQSASLDLYRPDELVRHLTSYGIWSIAL